MMRNTSGYLRVLRRGLRGRHPLIRRTDRAEARLAVAVLLLVLATIPLAGWVGARTWDTQSALAVQQTAERTLVTAKTQAAAETADATAGELTMVASASAPATWAWGDEKRRGDVTVDYGTPAGADVQIWVDPNGEQALAPLSATSAKISSVLVGLSLWFAAALLAAAVFGYGRWRLDRTRNREWSREIAAFLGSTSSH
ncbi:Rv1733c family protein [Rhodococcus aetherivorans]|uniref:Rv1733c family protein n=1 Tax=Rhodococcus aetherivorans TaxID=191292 RepID=UPI00163B5656|nr:hypothetical protein [Rhodococcus aetherivorans]MBC2590445.1 hypothetical protein [Rhodococcus aetherivorans]